MMQRLQTALKQVNSHIHRLDNLSNLIITTYAKSAINFQQEIGLSFWGEYCEKGTNNQLMEMYYHFKCNYYSDRILWEKKVKNKKYLERFQRKSESALRALEKFKLNYYLNTCTLKKE
jgi:hypothetical protein